MDFVYRHAWRGAMFATALATVSIQGCAWIGDTVAEKVYPDLQEPGDLEPPPTFKQFPSSAITQAILGGRGQGLNCSIPSLGKSFFKTPAKTADVSLHFRPSCVMHDLCYRHGYATYGYTQADCDRALQASAYRMCRQINGLKDQGNVFENCQVQAKKVLFGVSLGGAGSYKPGGESTYFEYDPMPEKANDYVVARAYDLAREQAAAGDLGVLTYRFFRNTVVARTLRVDPADPQRLLDGKSPAVPWPEQYIPTAPTEESLGNAQTGMIALSRKGASNTSQRFVQFLTTFEDGRTTLSFQRCPSPLSGCPSDSPSIGRMANVAGHPVLVSLAHSNSATDGASMALERLSLETGKNIGDYRLDGDNRIGDRYRFLQNELLLEKDRQGQDTHAWVLVRGMKLDAQGHITRNPDAQGYAERMLVIRQSLADGEASNTQRFLIDAAETGDPLSLVRLAPGAGVALVGLSWKPTDLARFDDQQKNLESPILSVWQLRERSQQLVRQEPVVLPADLHEGFVTRPPVVVDAGIAAPVVVWTRMTATGDTSRPTVSFDVRLTRLDPASAPLPTVGAFSCTLDLTKQIDSLDAAAIRGAANRKAGQPSKKALTEQTRQTATADLASRWQMSQTVVSQRPSASGGADDLAVTTVFSGYPGMSFQAVLNNDAGHFRFVRTLPQAPHLDCRENADRQASR